MIDLLIEIVTRMSVIITITGVIVIPTLVLYLLIMRFDKKQIFFRTCNRIFDVKDEDI